jgi:hypothetical protein
MLKVETKKKFKQIKSIVSINTILLKGEQWFFLFNYFLLIINNVELLKLALSSNHPQNTKEELFIFF